VTPGIGEALEMLSNYQEPTPEQGRTDGAIKVLVKP
jgi:hypothetical protein